MRFAGGTIAAKSTLALARVVASSFAEHHPGAPFYVLLADEVDGFFDPASEPYELLLLDDVEIPDPPRFRFGLPQQSLSYAATPYLIAKLLALGYDRVLFIKQESLVLGALDSVVQVLPAGGLALTPHLLSPLEGEDAEARELNILLSGVFNGGLVGVAAGEKADHFLRWWQDRVYRHCIHAVHDGMHYEQRWLDLVPAYFDGVHVVRDPGVNVGHWNLPERDVTIVNGTVRVGDDRCRLFRFSGYEPDRPDVVTHYSSRLDTAKLSSAPIFDRYRDALLQAGWEAAREWPYAYDRFDDGTPIPEIARDVYRRLDDVTPFGDPFEARRRDSFLGWLAESEPNRFWLAVYDRRPDLQAAFPDVSGRDRKAFVRWIRECGLREYTVPEALH